jgi:hypothetical protein
MSRTSPIIVIVFAIVVVLIAAGVYIYISRPSVPQTTSTTTTISQATLLNSTLLHVLNGTAFLIGSAGLGLYNGSYYFSVSQFSAALADLGVVQPNMNATFFFSLTSSTISVPFNLTVKLQRFAGDYRLDTVEFGLENGTEMERTDTMFFVNGVYHKCIWNETPAIQSPTQVFGCLKLNRTNALLINLNKFNVNFNVTRAYNSSFDGLKCLQVTGNFTMTPKAGGNATASGRFSMCISYAYIIPLALSISAASSSGQTTTLEMNLTGINGNVSQTYIDAVPS